MEEDDLVDTEEVETEVVEEVDSLEEDLEEDTKVVVQEDDHQVEDTEEDEPDDLNLQEEVENLVEETHMVGRNNIKAKALRRR